MDILKRRHFSFGYLCAKTCSYMFKIIEIYIIRIVPLNANNYNCSFECRQLDVFKRTQLELCVKITRIHLFIPTQNFRFTRWELFARLKLFVKKLFWTYAFRGITGAVIYVWICEATSHRYLHELHLLFCKYLCFCYRNVSAIVKNLNAM